MAGGFQWNADNFRRQIEGDIVKNLHAAGAYLTSKFREAVNTGQPYKRSVGKRGVSYRGLNPSLPGQLPHKVTGQFQRSITWQVDRTRHVLTCGSAMARAGWLQLGTTRMAARPWLSIVFNRERDTVARIILTGRR